MNIKFIEQQYPSLCYSCVKARHPASDDNIKAGYVGCCMRLLTDDGTSTGRDLHLDWGEITSAKVIAEGWIRNSHIKYTQSGHLINTQIITQCVSKCKQYKYLKE
jgi:hypothetical protein